MKLSRPEIRSIVNDVFAGTAGVDVAGLDESATQSEVEGWDSFAHIELVLAIEDRFGIEFATEEFARVVRIGAILDAIEEKTAD